MKYLLLVFLLMGCALTKPKVEPKKVEKIDLHKGHTPKHRRLLNCVDRYLEKDVKIGDAFEVCRSIFKRG